MLEIKIYSDVCGASASTKSYREIGGLLGLTNTFIQNVKRNGEKR